MAVHPFGDQIKVLLDKDEFNFSGGEEGTRSETGVVVEIPEEMLYIGFHSFAFENSYGDPTSLLKVVSWLKESVLARRVYWQSIQDSGRHIVDGDNEYVLLKITDIIAVDDDVDNKARIVSNIGKSGSFAV